MHDLVYAVKIRIIAEDAEMPARSRVDDEDDCGWVEDEESRQFSHAAYRNVSSAIKARQFVLRWLNSSGGHRTTSCDLTELSSAAPYTK